LHEVHGDFYCNKLWEQVYGRDLKIGC
jgi:hypothetical protein